MSRINDVLLEVQAQLVIVPALTNKVVVVYNEDDLLNSLKGVKNYPAAGITYEGMRSVDAPKPTDNVGVSSEMVIAIILVHQGDAIHATQQKKTVMIDLLDACRDRFLGQKSAITKHKWKFLVEAPAELRSGMVCWVQRWSLPIQMTTGPIIPR